MKAIAIFLCLILTACLPEKELIPSTKTIKEIVNVDVFALTYHQQKGSCTQLPISHRLIVFPYIELKSELNDIFFASLEVLLDSTTKTYKALYREYSGIDNSTDHSEIITLEDSYEILKANDKDRENDELILRNLGRIVPVLSGNKVSFQIGFFSNLNKEIVGSSHEGRVANKSTMLVDDNCTFVTSVE